MSSSGWIATPHLAPGGEHVDGAIVVRAEERPVGRRGHRELLDFLAQRDDVLACFAQGGREPLVLGDRLGELTLGLEEPLLERPNALGASCSRRRRKTSSSSALHLVLEVTHLAFILDEAPLVL